jgi:hypothetical protein
MTDEKTISSSAPSNISYQSDINDYKADRYSDTSSSVSSSWTGYSSQQPSIESSQSTISPYDSGLYSSSLSSTQTLNSSQNISSSQVTVIDLTGDTPSSSQTSIKH